MVPLVYQTPAGACRPRQRPLILPVLAMMSAIGFCLLPFISVRRTQSRMDAITGSMEWQTTWPLGITAGPRIYPSPLENRMTKMGVTWTRDWRSLNTTHETLTGQPTYRGCGMAPRIYELHPMLDIIEKSSSDQEIRQFVDVMQHGTDEQQREAIDAAADRALSSRQRTK